MIHWILFLFLSVQIIGLSSDETGLPNERSDVSLDSTITTATITISTSGSTTESVSSTIAATDPSDITTSSSADFTNSTDSTTNSTITVTDIINNPISDWSTNYTTDLSTNYITDHSADDTTELSSIYTTKSSIIYTSDPSIDSYSDNSTKNTTEPDTENTSEPGTEYSSDPTSDSTTDPTPDSTTDPTPDSTTDPTPDSTTDPTPDSTTDPTPDSTTDPTPDSTTDPTPDSTTDPTPDDTTDPGNATDPVSHTDDSTAYSTSDTITTEGTESSSESSTFIDTNSSTTDLTNYTTTEYPTDTYPSFSVSSTTSVVTTDDSNNTATPTEITTDGATEFAPQGVNSALLLGILIPVLVIGVTVILYLGYRSGRLHWPPKSIFSQAPDDTRPSYIPLKKLPAHCDQMLEVPSKLSNEYQLLATLSTDITNAESFIAAHIPDNKVKNRYVNILPYDSTRVKLIPEGDDYYSDYINASYVKGYMNEIEYIATQGPKAETCRDFWRMIFQEPIKVIVMVTQLEEMGKPKCYKYFPNLRETMTLEDISVWCTTELHFPIYTLRTLVLTKDDRKRSITHLHFREWPDFGCPSTPDLMLQFCQVMRQYINMAQPGITLVHCSAGVGRTGTLIAVDILLQQISENKKISVFDTVYKLRKHRINMVQSESQYAYIYKCLKEALENPSYLSSENSSTTSTEPIYENVECTRFSPPSKIPQDSVFSESECAL